MSRKYDKGMSKAKALLIVLGLLLVVMIVGCGLANVTYIGFILMGVGGGGFALTILSLIIWNALRERKRNAAHNVTIEEKMHMKKGRVMRCELYKQNVSDVRGQDDYDMLFKVWVETEEHGKTVTRRYVCPQRFMSGADVYICGDYKKPKECKLLDLSDRR